ncbi:MAG: DPP IV N-terminal domain-containing protein [Flavobacteriaceae bacterium]|nr:DPP IV N-terminal domain-containing protein [Flavobacteriaceae bacterium]
MKFIKKLGLLALLISATVTAQEKKTLSLNDATLGYYKGLYPKDVYNLMWLDNSDVYMQRKDNNFVLTDAKTNEVTRTISFSDFQKVYPKLKYLPFYIKNATASSITFSNGGTYHTFNYLENKNEVSVSADKKAQNNDYNDNAKAVAYTIENNLFVATAENPKIAVTDSKDKNIVSGQAIHRSEFGITKGTFWSPKGNFLAFYQKDESNVTDYPLVDITTYPAKLNNIKYPMAGQGSEKAKIGIFNLKTQQTSYLDIDTSDEHYLTNLSWTPDEKYILLAEVNRGQNHYELNLYDIVSGKKVRTICEESNDKWTEPEHDAVFLPNSNTDFLWFSEKDGFMNLYQYNTNGKFIKQVTSFKWVVQEVLGFDKEGKYVFISGTGADPREKNTFKVNLKNGKYERLTKVAGTHNTQLNSDGTYLIDNFSSVDIPRKIDIINTEKETEKNIFTADNPLKDYNLGKTEFVNLKSVDGTPLYAKITKPANFDPNKKYPVLIYVYGGPHAQLVTNSWLAGSSLWMPTFATLEDYIVFTVDNRGSDNRGFAFESVIHRNLGTHAIEDQMQGVKYLKSLPYVDANRIAVNGWSFGGFMTSSLLTRKPNEFRVGVAGGPVTDWKYYEVMYGERYMDTPQENPEGYKKARLHNHIQNLKGNLLIIHGSIDPTVVPQHSMTLLKEAVKKGVQIDFFTYPMHEHNVGGRDRAHLVEKMMKYIVEHNK